MFAEQKSIEHKPAKNDLKAETFQQVCANIINKLTVFSDLEEGVAAIRKSLQEKRRPVVLSFLNAHGFNICFKDIEFYQSLLASDFVFRDGIGLKIMYSLLGKNAGINLNGTDFIPYLLEQLSPQHLALIGTTNDVLDVALKHPAIARHNVVFCDHGFRSAPEYIEPLVRIKPTVVILGMGMPKQERVSVLLKKYLPGTTLIVNGGAIIDFMGNKVPRAPLIVRRVGLEWAFRLVIEPRRLFNRYVIGNASFLARAIKYNFVLRNQPAEGKNR